MKERLPGLIDVHVHVREPGATHKEDWDSVTAAALAGGVTQILAMPNTKPPVTDAHTLAAVLDLAAGKARCDYAQFVGAGADNAGQAAAAAPYAAALKMYLDQTYGPLRLDDMTDWMKHFEAWPGETPICLHAESRTLAAALLQCALSGKRAHVCHVSTREEITIIRAAKEHGLPVTCEVTPHHLFFSTADLERLGPGRCEVRPRLASPQDQQALWDNLAYIDCFATDHAPHTLVEKDGENPPPGFPGLESLLPLLLTAAAQGRLTLEDIRQRCYTNPRRIFGLPEQPDTWVDVNLDARWTFDAARTFTRCAWSPFQDMPLTGRVERVVLRGQTVFTEGSVLAQPGSGINMRQSMPLTARQ
jgi:carbamoyl-phosphate synthase/aspartate carbamoyltransferase/dihydroorotase